MTSRDRVIRTLSHQPVDRAPRDLWVAPAVEMFHGDETAEMARRYPVDLVRPELRAPRGQLARGAPCEVGSYTDAWGCTWQVRQRGLPGEIEHLPLADLNGLAAFRPPWEILEKTSFSAINRFSASTSRFVLAWSEVRPLERLQWLHGAEATFADLEAGTRPIRDLLDMLHDFYCRELSLWAGADVDGVVFMDDWRCPGGHSLSRSLFRELFKPLYREYCEILRAADKFVFLCVRGDVAESFGDLIQIGVDAIHADVFSMDLESLTERFRGRVTFWGATDLNGARSLRTPDEVRAAVRRLRSSLDFGRGGLIAQCEWGPGVAFQNVAALFEQWLAPLPMHAHAR